MLRDISDVIPEVIFVIVGRVGSVTLGSFPGDETPISSN